VSGTAPRTVPGGVGDPGRHDLRRLAVALRREWFERIGPALDEEFPGAGEALLFARAEVDDGPLVRVRIPAAWPLLKPAQPVVRRRVTALLTQQRGGVTVRVTFGGRASVAPSRGGPTGLEVVEPGDPHPSGWPEHARQLGEHLTHVDDTVRGVLAAGRPVAFSRRAVWFEWPTDQARTDVGRTPGAAHALLTAVQAWGRGARPFHIVREQG
jgi:hypothetical protein